MKKSNFYLLYSGDKSLLSNEVNKLKKNLNITSDIMILKMFRILL